MDAARLLVRPAIESLFRLLAVRNDKSLLYRIAVKERDDYRKWVFSAARRRGDPDTLVALDEQQWADFEQNYKEQFPDHALVEKGLSVPLAANAAGLSGYYDTHYRLYCKFTHAALAAMMGALDEFHTEDNRTMALCVQGALEEVTEMGGAIPNKERLMTRLNELVVSGDQTD